MIEGNHTRRTRERKADGLREKAWHRYSLRMILSRVFIPGFPTALHVLVLGLLLVCPSRGLP